LHVDFDLDVDWVHLNVYVNSQESSVY